MGMPFAVDLWATASFAVNASYIAIVSFVAAASFVDLVPCIITKA